MEERDAGKTTVDRQWPHNGNVARSRVDQLDPAAVWQLDSLGLLGPTERTEEIYKSNPEPD